MVAGRGAHILTVWSEESPHCQGVQEGQSAGKGKYFEIQQLREHRKQQRHVSYWQPVRRVEEGMRSSLGKLGFESEKA